MMLNTDFVITLIGVISFAGLGTFIRTGLSVLLHPFNLFSLVPNIVGSFILGLTKGASLKNKYINKGIGTGLCGSITTFSSFNYEFNILIISTNPNILLALLFITITFCVSAIAFYSGEKLSQYTTSKITAASSSNQDPKPPQIPQADTTGTDENLDDYHVDSAETKIQIQIKNNDPIVNDTGQLHEQNAAEIDKSENVGRTDTDTKAEKNTDSDQKMIWKWVCFFALMNTIVIPLCFIIDNRLWLASLFAPFGAASRWYLGLKFNKNARFGIPIGTLMANIMGSILLTVVIVISKESEDPRGETIWIEAITKGFCGCLSTVSSFVGELFALQRDAIGKMKKGNDDEIMWKDKIKTCKVSVIYFFVTILIAQILSSIPNSVRVWG